MASGGGGGGVVGLDVGGDECLYGPAAARKALAVQRFQSERLNA